MKNKTDEITLKLIQEIKKQKKEISNAERPKWLTNCTFSYNEKLTDAINIRVESVAKLISCAAFLIDKEKSYNEAGKFLGVETPTFSWCGYKTQEWLEDIKNLINKNQIELKKKKLESLESRLNAIISPELRAQMELEEISKELEG